MLQPFAFGPVLFCCFWPHVDFFLVLLEAAAAEGTGIPQFATVDGLRTK
jgi:hypothetical protein